MQKRDLNSLSNVFLKVVLYLTGYNATIYLIDKEIIR